MLQIGTTFSKTATKILLCGAGELGKEVAIEAQRLGLEVIALDRYENAPAMQVADRSYTLSMLDGEALRHIIEKEKPDYIVPEIEAIATDTLAKLEQEGFNIVPSAKATQLTMNREGIRRLAAEDLGIPTSPYAFADNKEDFTAAVDAIGIPCVVKPIMSSSGKGQSVIKSTADIDSAWHYAQEGGRAGKGKVIIEGFVDFDYEITLLTIRHKNGTSFCAPIGHIQEDGDYRQSWQPHPMSDIAVQSAEKIALKITEALGGWGLFGVELFIKDDQVIFSEVSPRPHDTGLVTLISQDLSEFALHLRAILGLPIPNITQHGPSASSVILPTGHSTETQFSGLEDALKEPDTQIRLFGKPEIAGRRRMGVALARDTSIEKAIEKAKASAMAVKVDF
uniref:Formate-dependent phosphoribosylglycinamide formyltransferase n=1 Tax=Hydrogenovibrio crunogenus (strain DSM 25203 / XCL-2) TaxID=317025 RepID=PURT_HYDCU|nr:RecName: Full=Formate-dependent phosphoribosylglycinamide formyltransferase; AltName: Full=5'-phosphoribosylglycinamide transformylase 2; AltName: Full=Formate-dependent GAR transformylase; AltName: Full=GAR transformylase 2; Short=GART 2; AltName: Full=Non-folate glycinamide ribonucleotide transformylase; AltName: Full=Phosphoribosylglycinamide formyltransferase 2 [Hydrogenovibrio crunogenus XCL-2]